MKKINWQIFISFNLLFSFILMLVSGLILYFKPEGSVARWLDWNILFLSKSSWEAIHTIFSFLFTIIAFFHILKIHLLNFFIYLNKKHHHALKEFFLSLAICVILLIGTIYTVPPVQSVYDLGNTLSDAWEETYDKPNEFVSASSTLEEIADYHYVPDSVILRKFEETGITGVQPDLTLREIASRHDSSPQQIYSKISDIGEEVSEPKSDIPKSDIPKFLTINEIAFVLNVETEEIIRFLESKKNIENIVPNTELLEISNRTNTSCSELRDELYQLKEK
ncbi:MAG: DUF4405 domain-containing protein [Bacteroidota bacterium]